MHSLVGALTFDALLAVLAAYPQYPALAGWWEGRFGIGRIHFGGIDVGDIDKLPRVIAGVYAGTVLHVGVDFRTHAPMPYLWPFAGTVSTFGFTRDSGSSSWST